MTTKCILITFRKLTTRDKALEGKKINITINTQQQTFQLKCCRPVKNGIANFYGQSFALPIFTKSFTLVVSLYIGPRLEKKLTQFVIGKDKIEQFTHRLNIFISDSALLKVIWQGKILDQEFQQNQKSQRTENDFFQMQQTDFNKDHKRSIFSPLMRQKKPKKKSFRLKNQQTASQPPSDSPHKFTLNTNDTNRINKQKQKKNTHQSIHKIRQISLDPSSSQQEKIHPIFKSKCRQKPSPKLRYQYCSLTPQNRSKLENNRTNVLNRMNFKSMVYTGFVGIISGLTAAQNEML